MKVSVIIAVYNAGNFLEKAVVSAIEQPETGEVLLYDDGSTDNSLNECRRLVKLDERVKLIENIGNVNKGEGAARNICFQNSVFEYVSFLDNDDYYLPGRFTKAKEILDNQKDIDGVYEAVGTNACDAISLERHLKRVSSTMGKADPMLTTMDIECKPSDLFEVLKSGKHGFFHFNGLTLRRSVFEKVPLIDLENPMPAIGNDSSFLYRLAAYVNLVPGRLNIPVAMRNVYEGNLTLSLYTSAEKRKKLKYDYHQYLLGKTFLSIALRKNYSKETNRGIIRHHLEYYNEYFIKQNSYLYRKLLKVVNLIKCVGQNPALIAKIV